jgi:hypothetical protein
MAYLRGYPRTMVTHGSAVASSVSGSLCMGPGLGLVRSFELTSSLSAMPGALVAILASLGCIFLAVGCSDVGVDKIVKPGSIRIRGPAIRDQGLVLRFSRNGKNRA